MSVRLVEKRLPILCAELRDQNALNCNLVGAVGINGEIGVPIVHGSGDTYKGDYTITPKVNAQQMPTKGKIMADDVTVKEIPFFNVSNTSGGSTVYIGKEV